MRHQHQQQRSSSTRVSAPVTVAAFQDRNFLIQSKHVPDIQEDDQREKEREEDEEEGEAHTRCVSAPSPTPRRWTPLGLPGT